MLTGDRLFRLAVLLVLGLVLGIAATGTIAAERVRYERIAPAEKAFVDVVLDLEQAIGQHNFAITARNEIGDAIRRRGHPNFADATVEWVRAQVDLLTLTIDPMQRARTALSYNQLRLDWLNERTSVAALKIELQNSEKEFHRIETLFEDTLVSESVYNKAETDRDSYAVQVQQKTELVASIEQALREAQENDPTSQLDQEQIKRLDQGLSRVEKLLDDIILLSPIDGEIGSISKQTGESVRPGETIATISSSQVKKIVGYVPQPIYLEPKVGMEVEIKTRRPTTSGLFSWLGADRQVARARVSKVSNRLEAVGSGVLRNRAAYKKVLPFTIDLVDLVDAEGEPIKLDIHPGELVDIHFIGAGE